MVTDTEQKRVAVLSDNDLLTRVIDQRLGNCPGIESIDLSAASRRPGKSGDDGQAFHLLVMAMSSPISEPLVALARHSLSDKIGRLPILIISDRPFRPAPDVGIYHLDFPFDLDGICKMVQEILLEFHAHAGKRVSSVSRGACSPRVGVTEPLG